MKTKLLLLVFLMTLLVFGCSTVKKVTTQQELPRTASYAGDTGGVTPEYTDNHWIHSVSERLFVSKHPKRGKLKELSSDEIKTYCQMAVEIHPRITKGIKKGDEKDISSLQKAECIDSVMRYAGKPEE